MALAPLTRIGEPPAPIPAAIATSRGYGPEGPQTQWVVDEVGVIRYKIDKYGVHWTFTRELAEALFWLDNRWRWRVCGPRGRKRLREDAAELC